MHKSIFVPCLFVLTVFTACQSEHKTQQEARLASIEIAGLSTTTQYKTARLTVKPANSNELAEEIVLNAPNFKLDTTFPPGDYIFTLDLLGESNSVLASTALPPCKASQVTLQAGANSVNIDVCNSKGVVLKLAEQSSVAVNPVSMERPLYYYYSLDCSKGSSSKLAIEKLADNLSNGNSLVDVDITSLGKLQFDFVSSEIDQNKAHVLLVQRDGTNLRVATKLASDNSIESVDLTSTSTDSAGNKTDVSYSFLGGYCKFR